MVIGLLETRHCDIEGSTIHKGWINDKHPITCSTNLSEDSRVVEKMQWQTADRENKPPKCSPFIDIEQIAKTRHADVEPFVFFVCFIQFLASGSRKSLHA